MGNSWCGTTENPQATPTLDHRDVIVSGNGNGRAHTADSTMDCTLKDLDSTVDCTWKDDCTLKDERTAEDEKKDGDSTPESVNSGEEADADHSADTDHSSERQETSDGEVSDTTADSAALRRESELQELAKKAVAGVPDWLDDVAEALEGNSPSPVRAKVKWIGPKAKGNKGKPTKGTKKNVGIPHPVAAGAGKKMTCGRVPTNDGKGLLGKKAEIKTNANENKIVKEKPRTEKAKREPEPVRKDPVPRPAHNMHKKGDVPARRRSGLRSVLLREQQR